MNIYPGEVARRRSPDTPVSLGPVAHDFRVNGAGYAVVELSVELGKLVRGVHTSFSNVPDCSSLNYVTDNKLLDCLILRHATGTVGAAHWINVAATVLSTTPVSALTSLKTIKVLDLTETFALNSIVEEMITCIQLISNICEDIGHSRFQDAKFTFQALE